MTTFAVTSVNSLLCQASTCFRIGSKLRCIRSTPTEMQSISENDFECLASTGVNTPPMANMTDDVLCGSYALDGLGADGEIRSLMGFPAAPSRRCVCQFHHIRNSKT